MIVYYTTTHYQVLCAIIHKLIYKTEEKAIILISDTRAGHEELCKKIKETNIFDEVIYYNDRLLVSNASRQYRLQKNTSNMKRILKNMCKEVEKNTPFKINTQNEYYLMSDFRPFPLYLISNKIRYNYFEDACGVLSRKHLLMNVLKSPWTNKVIKEFNLNGENELVINKYADISAQEEGFEDEKLIDFSVKKLVNQLSEKQKEDILKIFNVAKIRKSENKRALILTQPFIARKKITFHNQMRIYSLLIDYFCKDMDIYLKPHPMDNLSIYSKWFPDIKVLEAQMPSELLNVCVEGKFDSGISISSTAIYSLDKFIDDLIIFDANAEDEILKLHKYYATALMLDKIDITNYDLKLKGVNKLLLEAVIKSKTKINLENINYVGSHVKEQIKENVKKEINEEIDEEIDEDITEVIDEDTDEEEMNDNVDNKKPVIYVIANAKNVNFLNKINEQDIVIFFNYSRLYSKDADFITKYKEISRVIEIKKEDISEKNDKTRKEEMLVCAMNQEVLDEISKIKEQNELIHSKLKISLDSYTFISDEMKDKVIDILEKQNKLLRRKKI